MKEDTWGKNWASFERSLEKVEAAFRHFNTCVDTYGRDHKRTLEALSLLRKRQVELMERFRAADFQSKRP